MHPEVFDNCSTILLDVAGTVGSLAFAEDTLFALAKKNVEEFLSGRWEEEETQKLVAQLKTDNEEADFADVGKAVERFNALTDEKSTNVGLKSLQGLLYKQAFESGDLKAHVFEDVKSSLEEWSKHRKICIYSSGVQEAQKLYFQHSTAGDLSAFIAKYFDLSVGKKSEAGSYESIAGALEVKPQEMLFISDDLDEIKAASTAGCSTVLIAREGNAPLTDDDKKDRIVVVSFAELPLSAKRKMLSEADAEGPPTKVAKVETSESEKKASEVSEDVMEVDSTNTEKPTEEAKMEDEKKNDENEVASSTTSTEVPNADMEAEVEKLPETDETEAKVETTTETDTEVESKPEKDEKCVETTSEAAAATSEDSKEKDEEKEVKKTVEVNGQEATNGESGPEEKENKSEIANGTADSTPDAQPAVEEVAVKKLDLEEANETSTPPVSVEA